MSSPVLFMPSPEQFTSERCFISEWLNAPEDPVCSIARARVAPGVTTQWHRLRGIAERYVILQGVGRLEVGDSAPVEVRPAQVALISPGTRQRITNTGNEDLVFLCVCTPPFAPDRYEALEEALLRSPSPTQ